MIIIYGYSKLAAEVAYRFKLHGEKIVIVEAGKEKEFVLKDKYYDEFYDCVCFDDKELIKIGVKNKNLKAFMCLDNDFNKNLFVTLSVRSLNKDVSIMALAGDNNEAKKLRLAGANVILNPYETTAKKIFRKIHRPIALNLLDDILYSNSSLEIIEYEVPSNSILEDKMSKEITIFEDFNIIMLGIQDKELSKNFIFTSRGINHKIDGGDILVLLGHKEDLEKFIKEVNESAKVV